MLVIETFLHVGMRKEQEDTVWSHLFDPVFKDQMPAFRQTKEVIGPAVAVIS